MDDRRRVSVTVDKKDLPQVMNALLELLQQGKVLELTSGNIVSRKPNVSSDTLAAIKAFKEDV